MKHKSIVLTVLAALVVTLIGFVHPAPAYAACTTLSGSYASDATPFTSPNFTYNIGDVVSATNTSNDGTVTTVGLEININSTVYVFGGGTSTSANGSAVATQNGTGSVFFSNLNTVGKTMYWTITVGTTCGSAPAPVPFFTDGRLNKDAQASVVAYCDAPRTGDIQVYAVFKSVGYYAFTATKAEIEAVPAKPAANTLIKQALGAQLWRLTNGNLEIRRGTDGNSIYAYQWPNC